MALLLQAGDYMCELINEASKYGKVNERKMDIDLCCKKIEEEGYSIFVAFYDFIKKYGGLDDYLWKYGDNLSSSIDILINGKEAVEIP